MSAATSDASVGKPVTVRTETDLSLLYRILRTIIKPFRPRLVKPGKPLPAGSPRLEDHPRAKNKCKIIERRHEESGVWLYDVRPDSPATIAITRASSTIYYFAGGAFQSPPSGEHWSFVSKLTSELWSQYNVTLVSYPLAPNSPASDSLPLLRRLLTSVITEAASNGERLTLMGDSAGGNVALSLGFWWAEEVASLSSSLDVPEGSLRSTLQSIIAISPAVDLRNSNPAISQVDHSDPLLGATYTKDVARAWVAAPPMNPALLSSPEDPHISPVLHSPKSYRLLAELGITLHGIYGTYDVLAPDVDVLRQKCEKYGIEGKWLVWEGQMHCFVLAGTYGMKEGKKGIEWVISTLKGEAANWGRPAP
ncbi:Alpha/Beta hydrolase protein [Xylariales sp. AK1849]|nr:Alpha/Beta hydrolase protein [Xylariales sp. AK1849]